MTWSVEIRLPSMLPLELIAAIIYQLDLPSILRCRQVCSIFLSIVDNNVSIQYKVELLAANLVDGDPVAIPQDPAGRLALLKAHQEAWRPLHWTIETPLSMEGPAWELIGGVLGVSPSPDVLQITQLPSKYRRIPYKQWTLSNKGFEVEDFSMDPSQDLLVVVQRQDSSFMARFRVLLLSLSSGDPHPLAAELEGCEIFSWRFYDIRILGDYLGVMIFQDNDREMDDDELVIWNWKTGSILLNVNGRHLHSFAFLGDSLVLLGVIGGWMIAKLEVVDLSRTTAERTGVDYIEPLCSFDFPWARGTDLHTSLHIHSESPPSPLKGTSSVPFSTCHDDRLFVIRITPINVALFLPLSTLLSHIRCLPSEPRSHAFSWGEWGPMGTRALALRINPVWVCYAHGSRFISRAENGQLLILDFNRYSLRRELSDPSRTNPRIQNLTEPTTLNKGLESEFTTTLPVRITSCDLPEDMKNSTSHLMLTEDAIVALSIDETEVYVLSF